MTMDEPKQLTGTRELSNGAIYDYDKGRIVGMDASKNPAAITRDNSHEMHELRRAQTRNGIINGILAGTKQSDLSGGVQVMAEAMVEMATNPGVYKRASVDAFTAVLKAGDLVVARKDDAPGAGMTIQLSEDVANRLVELLGERRSKEE